VKTSLNAIIGLKVAQLTRLLLTLKVSPLLLCHS